MADKDPRAGIIDLLINKSAVKQDVADYSESVLAEFKTRVQLELDEFRKSINDQRIRLRFKDIGKHEFVVYIGSDVLVFQLHRNIFRLADDDPLWDSDYVKSNGANGYFGIINIYNFLAESYEQSRLNDRGYLIGRVFMNHEENCMVQGKGELGGLFNDLEHSKLSPELITSIIQCAMSYAIEFDLITPPYEMIQEVSVMQIQAISSDLHVATGKRLGFKFSTDDKNVF